MNKQRKHQINELARHTQGQSSEVQGGRLGGFSVSKDPDGGYRHNGDRVSVINGIVFVNGTYHGSAPRK